MTNKEKFLKLVSEKNTQTVKQAKERKKNREMLKESQTIALKVLEKLDELNWKQTDLAREMGVSPQQVNKIVKGKENLTLETQVKLQAVLDIPILASYYENKTTASNQTNAVIYAVAKIEEGGDTSVEEYSEILHLHCTYNKYEQQAS